jgi:hypothetical protein
MADVIHRVQLISNINHAFSQAQLSTTLGLLAGLPSGADFLEISFRARIFGNMPYTDLPAYRAIAQRVITLPICSTLTAIHHAALFANPPIPIHIDIQPAIPASIHITHVTHPHPMINILLLRPDPANQLPYP